jgi:hypothetical protein
VKALFEVDDVDWSSAQRRKPGGLLPAFDALSFCVAMPSDGTFDLHHMFCMHQTYYNRYQLILDLMKQKAQIHLPDLRAPQKVSTVMSTLVFDKVEEMNERPQTDVEEAAHTFTDLVSAVNTLSIRKVTGEVKRVT